MKNLILPCFLAMLVLLLGNGCERGTIESLYTNPDAIIDLLEDFLYNLDVRGVRGSYDVVMLYIELGPHGFEQRTDLIRIRQWAHAFVLGCLDHLVTMFIRSC